MSDFRGGRGNPRGRGGDRGRGGGGDRGHGGGGGGGGDRGRGGGRGRGGTFDVPMHGPRPSGGIYLAEKPANAPDQSIIAAEDALAKNTKGRTDIDGFKNYTVRKDYGTQGRPIVLRTNYFTVVTAFERGNGQNKTLFRYEAYLTPEVSKPKRRLLFEELLRQPFFQGVDCVTDDAKIIVTTKKLDKAEYNLELVVPAQGTPANQNQNQNQLPEFVQEARRRNTCRIKVEFKNTFDIGDMITYLKAPSAGAMYQGREDLIQMLNIILSRGPNNDNATVRNVGGAFYAFDTNDPNCQHQDLGGGLQAMRGYFASVRPAVNRLLVNLNVCSGAFYKRLHLIDLLREAGIGGVQGPEQQEIFIRKLKVVAEYRKDNTSNPFMSKIKTIVGYAKPPSPDSSTKKVSSLPPPKRFGNAKEIKFQYTSAPNAAPRTVTVFDYFKNHHGITLRHPDLPVLNVATPADPQWLPQELCTVLPGQPYRRFLGMKQESAMITFAARPPNANAMSIAGSGNAQGNGLKLWHLKADASGQDPQINGVQRFGFRISNDMLTVPGRILMTPSVKYAQSDARAQHGSWNSTNQVFVRPGKFSKWSVLVINFAGQGGDALSSNLLQDMLPKDALIDKFDKFLRSYGLQMGQRLRTHELWLDPLHLANRPSNDRKVRDFFEGAARAQIDMLFVVLKGYDKWLYSRVKLFGDVKYGIGTICSIGSKFQKPGGQGMYMGNLALKFNLKGGGISHSVPGTVGGVVDDKTMIMGIDVTHPSPGSVEGAPSIACVVASIDKHMFQWPGSIRTQESRKEMVTGLKDMVGERLELWRKKNKTLPNKIIIYRDGVAETQYNQVLQFEMGPFEEALEEKYGDKSKWPKRALIVVGKRHHTRFYPTKQEDADYNPQRQKGSWNPLPGTVVDRVIVGKILQEFYLQAHQGLQGTARPAHYVVLQDELGFTADALEAFTHKLCYLFNRATKAVSICPPAYYADLLCERGRAYLHSSMAENHGSESHYDGDEDWDGNGIHARLAETTWYV